MKIYISKFWVKFFLIFLSMIPIFYSKEEINSISNNGYCGLCKFGVTFVKNLLEEKFSRQELYDFLSDICASFGESKEVCAGSIKMYGDIVLNEISKRSKEEDEVCSGLGACPSQGIYESIEEYAQRVLEGKEDNENEEKLVELKSLKNDGDFYKIVQITDTHFDPEYKEGSISDCDLPVCCHDMPNKTDINFNDGKLAGMFGHLGKCESNSESIRAFSEKIKEIKPDYVMFTGDNIAHIVWKVKQDEVIKSTKTQIDIISGALGKDIPIYPAVGNHEKAPVDEFHGNETELLEGLANIFKQYLTDEAYDTFKKYGYYSLLDKKTNIRIISLNCLLCDSFNFYLFESSSQVQAMFNWLEGELNKAEKAGEKVHIMHHIPINHHQGSTDCNRRLRILMERYKNIVLGFFSGHTHTESVTVIHEYKNRTKPLILNFIASGYTTFPTYLPSFRIYDVNKDSKKVSDYTQFRLDLEKSNELKKAQWFESYKASSLFGVKNLEDLENINKYEVNEEYVKHHFTDAPGSEEKSKSKSNIKEEACKFIYDDIDDVLKCSGKNIFNDKFWMNVMQKIFKGWKKN